MPRGSPVPSCRDGLVRFLLIEVPGRSSHPREPITAPGALEGCGRSFTLSQPSQPTAAASGGWVSSARLRKPNRIPRGNQGAISTRAATPADHEGCQPALVCFWGTPIAPLQDRTRQRPVQLMLSASRFPNVPIQSLRIAAVPCTCSAVQFSAVPAAAHFDRPSAEQHAETLFRKQRDERTDCEHRAMEKRSWPILTFQLLLQPDWGPVQPTSCPVLSRQHMMVVMFRGTPGPDTPPLPCSVGPLPACHACLPARPLPNHTHHLTVTTASACNPICNHLFKACAFYLIHQ